MSAKPTIIDRISGNGVGDGLSRQLARDHRSGGPILERRLLVATLAENGDSFISRAGTSLFLARGAGRKKPRLAIAAAQAEHEDAAAAFDVSRRDIRPAA